MSSFDAEALERAAKSARELEASKHVKAAIELSKREQNVKAKDSDARKAEAMAESEKARITQIQVAGDEKRKTLQFERKSKEELMSRQLQLERQKLQEADQLARKREADLLEAKKRAQLEQEAIRRKMEEDILAQRKAADEHRAMLERQNSQARAIAEAEGRIKERRATEDIQARQIRLRGEETLKQYRLAIETTFSELGTSLSSYITDSGKLRNTVLTITAVAAGFFAMRESARVVGRVVERRLLTPSLVRETSRTTGAHGVRRRAAKALGLLPAEETGLSGIVLNKDLTGRVQETAVATANTKKNGAPFRHMLFYGPPGTGKTMVAKRLARTSGLDYAIMSGGDIGPLGKDGVTELHKLLDWGETSGRGLLLFIDEADAFLSSRSRAAMSEDHRNALNALLYRTGEASRNMMMVLATNRPGDLDAAVNDRVDDAMLFGLPDAQAREELLKIYFDKLVVRAGEDAPRRLGVLPSGAAKIRVEDGFDDEYFKELAHRTAGFSGRAISKLMLGVQGTVYGRKVPSLSLELMEEVVQRKLAEFDERKAMAVDASKADFTDSAADSITGGEAAAKARKSVSSKSTSSSSD